MTRTEYKTTLGQGSRLLRKLLRTDPGTTAYRAAQEAYAAWYETAKGNRAVVVATLKAAGCKEAEFA